LGRARGDGGAPARLDTDRVTVLLPHSGRALGYRVSGGRPVMRQAVRRPGVNSARGRGGEGDPTETSTRTIRIPSGSWICISVRPPRLGCRLQRDRGFLAAASRACPAWTSRTWIQVITGRLGGPAACPGTLSSPAEEEH